MCDLPREQLLPPGQSRNSRGWNRFTKIVTGYLRSPLHSLQALLDTHLHFYISKQFENYLRSLTKLVLKGKSESCKVTVFYPDTKVSSYRSNLRNEDKFDKDVKTRFTINDETH